MIVVEILRDEEGRVQEIRCRGDASSGDAEEEKIVEIGVTTLMRTAVVGLEWYLKLDPEVEDEPDRLVLRLKRDHLLNREIDAVLETMLLGLRAIEKRYPDHLGIDEASDRVKV